MLTSGFLLAFINLGPTELVIMLVIILILLGGSRLPSLLRGMQDGIHNFREGMGTRQDEVWQFSDGRQRQLTEPPKSERKWVIWLALSSGAFLLIVAGLEGMISAKQMLISLGVLTIWLAVWWFYFGKKRD